MPTRAPPPKTPEQPRPQLGGWRVPNTGVFVPGSARAGTTIEGQAPIGARVEALGQDIPVRADGSFSLRIPEQAAGSVMVRIHRPGTTTVPLRVEITQ